MEWATNGWALLGFALGVFVFGFFVGVVAFAVLKERTLDQIVERSEEVDVEVRKANERIELANDSLEVSKKTLAKARRIQLLAIRRDEEGGE